MHCWFLVGIPIQYVAYLCIILQLLWGSFKKHQLPLPSPVLIGLIILFAIDFIWLDSYTAFVVPVALLAIGIIVYYMDDEAKKLILRRITIWFSVLVAISLAAYIINIFKPLPSYGTLVKMDGYRWDFQNYLFFLLPGEYWNFARFSGPFAEPGHLAIACVFLMYANRLDFKHCKELWILLAATIMSYSLAGYVLLLFSLVLKLKAKYTILLIILLIGSYTYVSEIWENGHNPVNELILKRLEYSEQKGIKGNNRFEGNTNERFSVWMRQGDLIKGFGISEYTKLMTSTSLGGAGFKIYIIQYGLIGLLLIAAIYLTLALNARNRRFALSYFALIAICFIQRTYPLWMCWLIPYVCSLTRNKKEIVRHHSINLLATR